MKFKRILTGSLLCAGLIGTLVVANAQTMSGYQLSPKFLLDTYVSGSIFKLTSAYETASPEQAGVLFDRCGSLEGGYTDESDRPFPIYLSDDDGSYGDDRLKRYEGMFYGRKLDHVQYMELEDTSGNIDGTGVRTVQLYLEGKLGRLAGDNQTQGGTDLFYYNIILN